MCVISAKGMTMNQQRLYMSCLLRLWQARTEGEPTWRAWLEDASTGERLGFASLDELFDYLKAKVSFLECVSQSPDDDSISHAEHSGKP